MLFSKKVDPAAVLMQRLQDEVQYLRTQNQQLLDRLMVLTDRNAYVETKHQESVGRREAIELEKYRGMSTDEIKEKVAQEQKENEIVNIQLSQMFTGSSGQR